MACYLTYYDSAEGMTFTHQRAIAELKRSNIPDDQIEVFYREMGYQEDYDAQKVLRWLG